MPKAQKIKFQDGDRNQVGVNGHHIEEVLQACVERLEHYQAKEYCNENLQAICHLELAIETLQARQRRIKRK